MDNQKRSPIVIVTGGAQNIGLSIAQAFQHDGAHVIVADLNPPLNKDSDKDIGKDLDFFKTNVADEDSVMALMDYTAKTYGHLDVLVNNAGIAIEASIQETTCAEWDRVMAVNLRSVFLMCKYAFDLMCHENAQNPAIINISSIEGLGANPNHGAYGASKGAVASFTHNIALEYGPHGIRCNAIAPGWINTPFNATFLAQYPDPDRVAQEIKALHPVGRLGLPQDIANMAVFLASSKAGFVTGQEIIVAGGRMAKLPLPNL